MYVFRGEYLKEPGYISLARETEKKYIDEYYQSVLKNLRSQEELIVTQKAKLIKVYEAFKKPVSELSEEEKQFIVEAYNNYYMEQKQYENISDELISSMQNDIGKYIENPLEDIQGKIEAIEESIVEANEIYNKYFIVALDRDSITRENIDVILEKIKIAKENGLIFKIGIDGDMYEKSNDSGVDYQYSKEEIQLLSELDEALTINGFDNLVFSEKGKIIDKSDLENKWTFQQVINANRKIDEHAQYILDNKMSPFEAMIYIHKLATAYAYKGGQNIEDSRVLPSILNTDQIVCSGYATFVKAIIDRVNMPGLKCDLKGCYIYDSTKLLGGHCHNLIHIEDPKYGVSGTYMEDACWDTGVEETSKGLAHCLYPISDVMQFKGKTEYRDVEGDSRGNHLLIDREKLDEMIQQSFAVLNDPNWNPRLDNLKKWFSGFLDIFHRKTPPEMVSKYVHSSEPISVEKYKEAFRAVLRTKNIDEEEIERLVNEEIENSIQTSTETFNLHAQNTFSNLLSSRDRKHKIKQSGGPSPTQ